MEFKWLDVFKVLDMGLKTRIRNFIRALNGRRKVEQQNTIRDTIYVSSRKYGDEYTASHEFLDCKDRLLDIKGWNAVPEFSGTSFSLYGQNGQALSAMYPNAGDFIRISFEVFHTYWLQVRHVLEDSDAAQVICTPSCGPMETEVRKPTFSLLPGSCHCIFRVELQANKNLAVQLFITEPEDGNVNVRPNLARKDWDAFRDLPWKTLVDFLAGNSDKIENDESKCRQTA